MKLINKSCQVVSELNDTENVTKILTYSVMTVVLIKITI